MADVHVSQEDLAALSKVAADEQRSVEEVLHAAVLDYTSGWRRQRDALLDAVLETDSKLLRRLGSA